MEWHEDMDRGDKQLKDECTYNNECQTGCCLQPRRKGGKKGKGGKGGRGKDRWLQEDNESMDEDAYWGQKMSSGKKGKKGRKGQKYCFVEDKCDEDWDDRRGGASVGFVVPILAFIIVVILICALFAQHKYYKKLINQVEVIQA